MRISLPAIAVVASTLLPSAYANFDVYRVKSIKPYAQGGTSLGWMIFAAEPSCDTVVKRATTNGWWESSNDVSGDKYGFRCEGDGCRTQSSPSDVDTLEMNLNSVHHYTIYKEYGLSMVGLDGKVYGNCIVFPHGDFNCPLEAGSSSSFVGWRKFRCLNEGIQPSE